jgi:hypothetical protein
MDERVNCMACLVIDDDATAPGVAVVDGVTHALTTVGVGIRHYTLCDFDDAGVLLPGAYYGRLVGADRILWTDPGRSCLPGKQG